MFKRENPVEKWNRNISSVNCCQSSNSTGTSRTTSSINNHLIKLRPLLWASSCEMGISFYHPVSSCLDLSWRWTQCYILKMWTSLCLSHLRSALVKMIQVKCQLWSLLRMLAGLDVLWFPHLCHCLSSVLCWTEHVLETNVITLVKCSDLVFMHLLISHFFSSFAFHSLAWAWKIMTTCSK